MCAEVCVGSWVAGFPDRTEVSSADSDHEYAETESEENETGMCPINDVHEGWAAGEPVVAGVR